MLRTRKSSKSLDVYQSPGFDNTAIWGWGRSAMPLRCRLIRTLAISVVACVSCITAAAAQSSAPSPASMTLYASLDVRLADQAIEACSAIIAASDNDSAAAATAYGYRGIALRRRGRDAQDREQSLRDLEKAAGSGLDAAIAYAKDREQFAQPNGSFQAVARACVDMLAEFQAVSASASRPARSSGRSMTPSTGPRSQPASISPTPTVCLLPSTIGCSGMG